MPTNSHGTFSPSRQPKSSSSTFLPTVHFALTAAGNCKTFVVNVRGTLVFASYRASSGYNLIMRPGMKALLRRLSQLGEVVIFSDEDLMVVLLRL